MSQVLTLGEDTLRRLAGLLVCVLALAGCTAFAQVVELQEDLEAAGYSSTSINHNITNGHSSLVIETEMPGDQPTDEDADKIAEIVWKQYSADFDDLTISIDNTAVYLEATAAELTDQFGPRPARENASSGTDVTAIVVVLVVAALFAGLMVLLWWRGRRPPPPVAPPAPRQMPNPYQQPPQGGPQGPNYTV